jgi:hypothetical protein
MRKWNITSEKRPDADAIKTYNVIFNLQLGSAHHKVLFTVNCPQPTVEAMYIKP